ncbi:carbohydrate binding domain-containing protein [Candidatus Roizmanbacteria bacterium]|nr:carbohydrate binding domain-containing protein [Candidatus Roizmanbacteria bacterium]
MNNMAIEQLVKINTRKAITLLFIVFSLGIFFYSQTPVSAFIVNDLPADNLLQNPWFRSNIDPNKPGTDYWTVDEYWVAVQKPTQPSPDIENGTAVKIGPVEFHGTGEPGVPGYISQVVSANSNNTTLKFQTWWVAVRHDIFEVQIYGGDTQNGPWTSVWTPFSETNDPSDWVQTSLFQTTIAQGYPFYKVELMGQFSADNSLGIKVTGVYFATETEGQPGTTPTPTPTSAPTPTPTPGSQVSLQNPGFEEGTSGWNMGTGTSVTNSIFHNGSASGEIIAPPSGSNVINQVINVTGGQNYQISGWMKTDSISNQSRIVVQWRDSNNSLLATSMIGSSLSGTNDWSLVSSSVTAPATAVAADMRLTVRNGSGTAWFDDLSFE